MEFISAYEKYPVFWDPKHPDHKNRNKLNDGWAQLQNEFSAEVQIAEVKRKKKSLMSTFRSLRKKVVESEKNGQRNANALGFRLALYTDF